MKKILVVTLMLVMTASNCLAMTFSQPVEIGTIVASNIGGFAFREGNIENNGTLSKYGRKNVYEIGIAKFISDSDKLYFHYKMGDWQKNIKGYMNFGDNNINNTVPVNLMYAKIFKIKSNNGMVFYLIHDTYDLPDENWWTLIGRKKDGVWVKYFDTDSITVKYFGESARAGHAYVWKGQSICCDNFIVNGDTMIIEYSRYHKNIGKNGKLIKEGEFRFKWDDAAQWFGVEHIVY